MSKFPPNRPSTSTGGRQSVSLIYGKHLRDYTQQDYGVNNATWCCLKIGDLMLFRSEQAKYTLTQHFIGNFFFKALFPKDQHLSEIKKLDLPRKEILSQVLTPDNCKMSIIEVPAFGKIPARWAIGITGIGGLYKKNIAKLCPVDRLHGIVNVTWKVPNFPAFVDVSKWRIPVADNEKEYIFKYFDEIAARIDFAMNNNLFVLVHCWAGVSRSATVVIAYLMKYRDLKVYDALDLVKRYRPIAQPSEAFMKQLHEYARQLKTKQTGGH